MADEKPENEGQPEIKPEVKPSEPVSLTAAEMDARIEKDPAFAEDYLNGRIKVTIVDAEAAKPEEELKPEVKPEAAKPEEKPKEEGAPVGPAAGAKPVKTDEGLFVVEMEDGQKLTYKSKPEALKAIREKENMVRRYRKEVEEMRGRMAAQTEELEKLKISPAKPEAKPEAKPKIELPDPLSPDYLEKLGQYIVAQAEEIAQLKKDREADKSTSEQKEREREQRDAYREGLKNRFKDANSFIGRHPEYKTEQPLEVVHDEYAIFFRELGALAGTDGSAAQNKAIMDLYLKPEGSEMGQKIKAEAEKIGLRPPADLEKLFKVLKLMDRSKKLLKHDEVSGKAVPFTLEETHEYLMMKEGSPAPAAEPAPAQPNAPLSPEAEAAKAAAELKGKTATDFPAADGGAAPTEASKLTYLQMDAILDTPKDVLRKDPVKRKMWEAVHARLGQPVPRLEGILNP